MLAFLDPWCKVHPKTWRSCYYSLALKPMCIESHRIRCDLPIVCTYNVLYMFANFIEARDLSFYYNVVIMNKHCMSIVIKTLMLFLHFFSFFLVIVVQKHGLQYTQRWTHWGSPTSFGWACGEDTKHVGIAICSSVWGKIDKVVEFRRFFYTQIFIISKFWNHATMSICLWGILKH